MADMEQFRAMSPLELETAIADRRNDLFQLRVSAATHQLDDNSQVRKARKDIARMLTVLSAKLNAPVAGQEGA